MGAWLAGNFGFSFLWVLLGFAVYVARQRDQLRKKRHETLHLKAALCDAKALVDVLADPPSWLYFPKRQRVDWLNKTIKQLWPYVDDYVQALLQDSGTQKAIQDTIKLYNIESSAFETCTVGDDPPRIVNVRMFDSDEGVDGRVRDITFDLELSYSGDAQIKGTISSVRGIKGKITTMSELPSRTEPMPKKHTRPNQIDSIIRKTCICKTER